MGSVLVTLINSVSICALLRSQVFLCVVRYLVAGNWKMNGDLAFVSEFT